MQLSKLLPEKIQRNIKNWHKEVKEKFPFVGPPKNISLNDYFLTNNYFVFSFVRHPFDRLVSAYLHKIIGNPEKYAGDRNEIIKIYGENITFEKFIKYVIEEVQRFIKCFPKIEKKFCKKVNVHWKPFYLKCPYCDINYNHFIGRLETFDRDFR